MSNLINNAVLACTPNQEVVARFVAIMPQEILDTIRKEKLSQFDFAMSIVKLSVEMELCTLEQAWNVVFNGTYAEFKDAIYEILEAECHPKA